MTRFMSEDCFVFQNKTRGCFRSELVHVLASSLTQDKLLPADPDLASLHLISLSLTFFVFQPLSPVHFLVCSTTVPERMFSP